MAAAETAAANTKRGLALTVTTAEEVIAVEIGGGEKKAQGSWKILQCRKLAEQLRRPGLTWPSLRIAWQ